MTTAIEREVVAGYLGVDELLAVCSAAGDRKALARVRATALSRSHGAHNCDLNWRTDDGGVAWWTRTRGRAESGFLPWADVWRIATAGATPERVQALSDAYGAYIRHVTDFIPCPAPYDPDPNPYQTREQWAAEYGNAHSARYGELDRAMGAAKRAIILESAVEQLGLFEVAA